MVLGSGLRFGLGLGMAMAIGMGLGMEMEIGTGSVEFCVLDQSLRILLQLTLGLLTWYCIVRFDQVSDFVLFQTRGSARHGELGSVTRNRPAYPQAT